MTNNQLRQEVINIKYNNHITFKKQAENIGIRTDSFSSWLKGDYDLGAERALILEQYIYTIKGE